MNVSYDSYRVFYYVARYQNFTLAAKALFLTQPTVSHYILELEKELDCTLFVRSKRGVRLTNEGKVLYSHISRAYTEIYRGEEELKSYLEMGQGTIKIGASETSLRNYLLPILGRFRAKHPGVQLRIRNTTCQLAPSALRDGTLDLAIMTTPFPTQDLEVKNLQEFSMAIIAGPTHRELLGRPVSFREMAEYPMICLEPGTAGRYYMDTLFASHGIALHPHVELSTADLITPLAVQDMGIGFVPRIFAKKELEEGSVLELMPAEALPTRYICLMTDPKSELSMACKQFIREM